MSVSVNGGSSAFADAPPAASCVRVVVRLRPLSPKEALDGAQVCVSVVDADTTTAAPPTTVCVRGADPACLPGHPAANKVFVFDRVFAPDASQEAIYAHSVRPLVDSFLTGFNVTTLAYGQTGSGKTWTMGTGLGNAVLPSENVGIVPRAIKDIFGFLETKKSTLGDKLYFSVHVSFLELYNEDIIDLLNPRPRTAQSSSSATAPTIREDSHGQIVWINVREEPVSTPDELLNCLQRGSLCRSTGSTDMNASSSRSHAIFSIILKQQISSAAPTAETRPSTEVNYSGEDSLQVDLQSESVSLTETWATLISKFHFVDLAGSERLKRTNAEGDRKREGISINQGLLALGNVISALGDEAKKSSHVPYRDSKLTRMLQDSLGGNSQTLMIACASPSESSYGETVSTLTYANRARNIKNKAVVNREFAASGANAAAEKEIRALRTLVADLRDEIVALRSGSSAAHIPAIADISLAAESSVLNNDYFSSAITAHERDYQLHLQGERELATMLETVRAELRTSRFDCDRFGFKCSRLMDRMNSVLEELNSVKIERDAASVELEQWRSGKLRLEKVGVQSSVASIKAESAGSNTDEGMDRSVITKMIADYNNTISDLKFRLSETSDRLAWYNEVVSTFSSEESRREKILATFNSLPENTNEVPTPRSIRTIKAHENPSHEVLEERKLWKALEVDADLKQVLGPESETRTSSDVVSDAPKARLFGIPKEATNTFAPSQLSVNSEGVQWNEDDEYDDMEVDMDMDDPYHDESPHLGEVAIPMKESTTSANETLASNEKILPPAVADRSSDIYMLIHRLQADIAQHQALIDKQTKREQAYQAFREAYEAKLNGLQSQLAAVGRERDEALKKIRSGGGGNGKDRPGTAAIKQKFDEQKRKLEMQIAEFKKKMAEKAKDNAQSKNDVLTKQLMQTIDALKGMWAMKELKKESMKIRDMKTAKEREIARLRKREKVATELAKKLERSNQLQKIILKRRSDEAMQSHSKLKTVMALLKKSGSSQRFKAGVMSPSQSSLPSSAGRFSNRILGSICEDEALLKSMKFGSLQTGSDNPPLAIHSKFKKQMIDKELSTTGKRFMKREELTTQGNSRFSNRRTGIRGIEYRKRKIAR
ncbi:Kinesin-like protein kif21a [Entophlyctis luteolus]|nr:Kinesin-like protein kif21a [Entophlyctis luteolus]